MQRKDQCREEDIESSMYVPVCTETDACTLMAYQKALLLNCDETPCKEFTSFPANVVFSVPSPFLKKNCHLALVMICESLVPRANPQIPQLVNRRGASEKSQAAKDWLVVMFFLFHVDLIVHTTDSFSNVCVHIYVKIHLHLSMFLNMFVYIHIYIPPYYIYIILSRWEM